MALLEPPAYSKTGLAASSLLSFSDRAASVAAKWSDDRYRELSDARLQKARHEMQMRRGPVASLARSRFLVLSQDPAAKSSVLFRDAPDSPNDSRSLARLSRECSRLA